MSIKEIQERHDEDMEEYTRYFDDVGDVPIEVKDRGELLDALREIGELPGKWRSENGQSGWSFESDKGDELEAILDKL